MAEKHTVPRRSRLDLFTPAERAICDAVDVVEAAGAHPHLTTAVILLGQAREAVADFVDGAPERTVACREIKRPGTDPVMISTDANTREVFVFDVDGDVQVTLPPWATDLSDSKLDSLVRHLLPQIEARARRSNAAGHKTLRLQFAQLLGLKMVEEEE